ncbi:hypothetical protein D7V86_08030 [bacterium D16-51]|nr:hypothetical protein D7V96_09235 [bacterium D16-59]RKI60778.1 hypothetical protein D7V86_08030 [bacterium D16-51]
MGKHLKGYWAVIIFVCVIAGVFLYTMQYAYYEYDYKIVPGRDFITLSYLQNDGSQNEVKCYGNVIETQEFIYHFKIQEGKFFGPGYYEIWLSQLKTGKDFRLVYAYDSRQHQNIKWHSNMVKPFSHGFKSMTVSEDGTSKDVAKMDGEGLSDKTDIAYAAIVYLRIKLLQKLLAGYAVFEAVLLIFGYILYKKPGVICNLIYRKLSACHLKAIRRAGCILPLCGAAAMFLIRLAVS